jgi:heme oxygenase
MRLFSSLISFLQQEKQVAEVIDRKSSLPKIVVADAMQMSDNKRQMVLSMSMKDLEIISTLLSFDVQRNHPLHRDDVLYKLSNIQEQVETSAANRNKSVQARSKSMRK